MPSGVPLNDTIAQHFTVPSPGAVNDKVRAFFDKWYFGSGSPEGVVTAGIGSLYIDDDAADAASAMWTKNTGAGNTGWVQGAPPSATSQAVAIGVALSDETTAITTGDAKATIRAPFAFTLTAVRATLSTASSSGLPTVDINEGGTTVLSTKITIDANEKTSVTAATPAVISDSAIADDAEITFDVDVAGTGAKGLKVWLIGTKP